MNKVINVNQADFQKEVVDRSHKEAVLVDFWAPWCGPCRMLGPVLERLADEPGSTFTLAKVNSDNNQQLAMQYGVRGIPNVKAFVNGKLVDEFVGAQPEPMVRQFIQRLPKPAGASANGQTAKHNGQAPANDPASRLRQARELMQKGDGCAALPKLQDFPASPQFDASQKLLPLAEFLCHAARGQYNGRDDMDNLYRQAADAIRRREYSAALYSLLTIVHHDKSYREGEAKKVMLGLFELIGEDDHLTRAYRQQLASAIF
ncbi:MAG: thioredoxin [Ardenticatenaceae bacterium]|nr:thioredoxin [Ardenticatenaceae bacterium]